MGVKVNEANQESSEASLYTGVCPLKCLAVNPNVQELETLGFKPKKEPNYQTDRGVRVAFVLEGEVNGSRVLAFHSVFVENKVSTNKDATKIEVVDGYGKSTYLDRQIVEKGPMPNDVITKYTWIDFKSLRQAYVGETDLLRFISALVGVKKGETISFDTMPQIAKGNVKELKEIVKQAKAKGNMVKMLLGVRDGKYQDVFGKFVERIYSRDMSYLHKEYVANASYITNTDFGPISLTSFNSADFELREWGGGSNHAFGAASQKQETSIPQSVGVGGPVGFGQSAGSGVSSLGSDDDDLPF